MTDRKSRRVVIINNINSDTIDQAIFILKSDQPDSLQKSRESYIVREAQSIINSYVRQVERFRSGETDKKSTRKRKRRNKNIFVTAIAAISVLVVCIGFIKFIL